MNSTGKITQQGEFATITFERRLPYPIEEVWKALTDPAQRAAWFGKTTLEPREGGAFEMIADGAPVPEDMRRVTGRILTWDPPRIFEHEWKQRILGDTIARYTLVADGSDTILTFTHSGLTTKDAAGFIPGEHAYLDRLQAQLEHVTLPPWSERYGEVQIAYGEE